MSQNNLLFIIWSIANRLRGDCRQTECCKVIRPLTVPRRRECMSDATKFAVLNVPRGRLLESEILMKQAASNSKEQFAASPDLKQELINAIISGFDAHTEMSSQALNSEEVQRGLRDILLGPAKLYEALRGQV